MSKDEPKLKEISNAELCAMWLNDEISLSKYMWNFKFSPKPQENNATQEETR